jgi:hypothetical protein
MIPGFVLAQEASGTVIPSSDKVKDTAQQTDLIEIVTKLFKIHPPKKIKEEKGKKIYFSLLPISSTVPGGSGRALITSTTAATYLGPRKTTNISSATFTPYWNFQDRFGLPLRTSIWLPNNSWTIQGDTRFLYYPQFTWGLGGEHPDDQKLLVDYKYIRFYQSVLKKITPYFFAGAGYHLDYHLNIKTEDPNANLKQYTGYEFGTGSNSFSSGISLDLLYDTRNNSINSFPGSYANIVYRTNPTFLGSNNGWQSLYVDIRKYISLNKANPNQQNTLAFWSYLWTVFNSPAPYLDLPGIGWDPYNRSGRGIDQNRYSGKTLLYFETEYRRDITQNGLLGFVIFANINTVSGQQSSFGSWNPATGAGLRIKFDKTSRTNIGIDYGFSKDYSSLMFSLGEAF